MRMKDSTYCRNKKSIHSDKTAHVETRSLRCRWKRTRKLELLNSERQILMGVDRWEDLRKYVGIVQGHQLSVAIERATIKEAAD